MIFMRNEAVEWMRHYGGAGLTSIMAWLGAALSGDIGFLREFDI